MLQVNADVDDAEDCGDGEDGAVMVNERMRKRYAMSSMAKYRE